MTNPTGFLIIEGPAENGSLAYNELKGRWLNIGTTQNYSLYIMYTTSATTPSASFIKSAPDQTYLAQNVANSTTFDSGAFGAVAQTQYWAHAVVVEDATGDETVFTSTSSDIYFSFMGLLSCLLLGVSR